MSRLLGPSAVALALLSGAASGRTCPPPPSSAPGVAPATTSASPPPSASDRIDAYFQAPQSPQTFRALAGMGDPEIEPSEAWGDSRPFTQPEVALLHTLFPSVDLHGSDRFSTWDAGDCRLGQPLATLKQRIAQLGATSSYVAQWIRVQQAVFSRCVHEGQPGGADALPPPMPTRDRTLARLQRADRAYQVASLLFYQQRFDEAASAYDRAAKTPGSQRAFARYMALAIRAGSAPSNWGDRHPLVPVERSLPDARALLADPTISVVHPLVYDLIGWIGATDQSLPARRVQVRQTLDALEAPLARISGDAETRRRYAQASYGLSFLFSQFPDLAAFLDGAIPSDHTGSLAMAEAARTDPLAAWLVFPTSPYQTQAWATVEPVQGEARLRAELALRKGARFDAANAWSHQALMWEPARYDPSLWAIVDDELAAAQGCTDDRAAAAAGSDLFHQIRTALMYAPAGTQAAALDAVISHLSAFPAKTSAVYGASLRQGLRWLMTTGRLTDARRLRDSLGLTASADSDFMRQRGILPLLMVLAEDEDHLAPLLSGDAYDQAALLNRLSIAEMTRLARREDVAPEDRSMFARTAWTRTYALGRTMDPELDAQMRRLNPEITGAWRSRVGRPVRPGDRAVLQDVLASPGLNLTIDEWSRRRAGPGSESGGRGLAGLDHNKNNDDDWWCPWAPKANETAFNLALYESFAGDQSWHSGGSTGEWRPAAPPQLEVALSASFLLSSTDKAELSALSRIESAPQSLTEQTLDWVAHPGLFGSRAGQADALAVAIQTTRWGCDWAGRHGAYSHAAFLMLHQRFPTSPAAARTKYWFDCNGPPCQPRREDLPPVPNPSLRRERGFAAFLGQIGL